MKRIATTKFGELRISSIGSMAHFYYVHPKHSVLELGAIRYFDEFKPLKHLGPFIEMMLQMIKVIEARIRS